MSIKHRKCAISMGLGLLNVGILVISAHADPLIDRYPWLVKAQTEMTYSECNAAMLHDTNYWWSHGKCHMKFIRYAAGVAVVDVRAEEDADSIVRKGELLTAITQYRPTENVYCEHGGYCHSASKVKLLGSVKTGSDNGTYKSGDDSDSWQGVSTSCELLIADRVNIAKANALSLLEGCR